MRRVNRLCAMTAIGAERKPSLEAACFRFAPIPAVHGNALQPVIPLTVADLRARLLPGGIGLHRASSTIGNADLGGPPARR